MLTSYNHRLDPTTRSCIGCGAQARQIENDGQYAQCPAFYRTIGDGIEVAITTHEELIVLTGGEVMTLCQSTMFELRDAIDEGVDELRKGDRSKVTPT